MFVYQLHSSRKITAVVTALALFALLYLSNTYFNYLPGSLQSLHALDFPEAVATGSRDLLDHISNSTLGIFIINLPSRTDRKDSASLAAALTGLQVEFVPGVSSFNEKAFPPGAKEANLNHRGTAACRSHMNAAQMIVEQNITSALILEDDADWDIRIKSQMRDFAKASRLLVQPLEGTTDQFLDTSYPQPDAQHQEPMDFDINQVSTGEPTTSPYGDIDRWDMLWVGHCGCRFPWAADLNVPIGRAVIPNDETVPARHHIDIEFGDTQLLDQYPDHTRVVARSRINTCTLGYALSQAGARRLLYELGVHKMDAACDMMFQAMCDGVRGRDLLTCLSPQPALFSHHRPVAERWTWSDIEDSDDHGLNDDPSSTNIRWATRLNLRKLARGDTDYNDRYKDDD